MEGKTTERQCIIVRIIQQAFVGSSFVARALLGVWGFKGKFDMFPLWQPYQERGLSSRATSVRGGPPDPDWG